MAWQSFQRFGGELTTKGLAAYVASREGVLSPRTVAFYMDALSSFSKWAFRKKYIKVNPFDGFVRTRPEPPVPKAMKWTEAITQIENIGGKKFSKRDRMILAFLLHTGARSNEALNLTLDQLDMEDGRVTFTNTKGRRPRTVYLSPAFKEQMREYLEWRDLLWPSSEYLFPARGGGPMRYEYAQKIPHDYRLNLTLHQLRHTFCTQALKQTKDLRLVQELAGHSSIVTTTKYLLVTDEDKRNAAVAIEGDMTQKVNKRGKRVA